MTESEKGRGKDAVTLPVMVENTATISIHYCHRCRWLLRSAWMGQELLTTFEGDIGRLSLLPNGEGHFSIWVGHHCVWERKRDGGFPELPILKQRVRDVVSPDKSLGHSDKLASISSDLQNDH